MKKKILLIYGSYGSGHKTIAQYIKTFIDENSNYETKIMDIVDYSNFLGRVGVKLFNFNIKHRTKTLFSMFYDFFDHKVSTMNYKTFVKKSFDNVKLREEFSNYKPDLVICTHFFGNAITSYYNKLGLINSKIITVITDYKAHQMWIANSKYDDALVVANEMIKKEIVHKGVIAKKVYPFGIPLNKEANEKLSNKDVVYKMYGVTGKRPIFLFFGGGSDGSLTYYEYFKTLVKQQYDIDIIFIAGKNKELKDKCTSYVMKKNIKNIAVLGFTQDVFNLMNISDAVITKAGGATVTECMALNTPIIIIPGYGGQEKHNEKYLLWRRFALRCKTTFGLKKVVKKCIDNPVIFTRIKDRMLKQEKNNSAKKIFELTKKMLGD